MAVLSLLAIVARMPSRLHQVCARPGSALSACGSSGTAEYGSPARYRTDNSVRPSASGRAAAIPWPPSLSAVRLLPASARRRLGSPVPGLPRLLLSSALSNINLMLDVAGRHGLHPPARAGGLAPRLCVHGLNSSSQHLFGAALICSDRSLRSFHPMPCRPALRAGLPQRRPPA